VALRSIIRDSSGRRKVSNETYMLFNNYIILQRDTIMDVMPAIVDARIDEQILRPAPPVREPLKKLCRPLRKTSPSLRMRKSIKQDNL